MNASQDRIRIHRASASRLNNQNRRVSDFSISGTESVESAVDSTVVSESILFEYRGQLPVTISELDFRQNRSWQLLYFYRFLQIAAMDVWPEEI